MCTIAEKFLWKFLQEGLGVGSRILEPCLDSSLWVNELGVPDKLSFLYKLKISFFIFLASKNNLIDNIFILQVYDFVFSCWKDKF